MKILPIDSTDSGIVISVKEVHSSNPQIYSIKDVSKMTFSK